MKTKWFNLLLFLMIAAVTRADVIITNTAGYNITWDGNDGDFSGVAVPANLALSGTAVASSELNGGATVHQIANLNDGVYGNNNSWIGDPTPDPVFAGILLDQTYDITSFAFGRDNNDGFRDRADGTYTIQLSSNGGANWFTIATLTYDALAGDEAAGGTFDRWWRHEYEVSITGGDPIQANALRIMVPDGGVAEGTAIDEIEIYGTPVPEPSTLVYWVFSAMGLLARRRRIFFGSASEGAGIVKD